MSKADELPSIDNYERAALHVAVADELYASGGHYHARTPGTVLSSFAGRGLIEKGLIQPCGTRGREELFRVTTLGREVHRANTEISNNRDGADHLREIRALLSQSEPT